MRRLLKPIAFWLLGIGLAFAADEFSLGQCIRVAIEKSPRIVEANEELLIKQMELRQARLKLYTPDVIVIPGVYWNSLNGGSNIGTYFNIEIRSIFSGYEEIFILRREKILLAIRNEQLSLTRRDVTRETARAYSDVVTRREIEEYRRQISDWAGRLEADVAKRKEMGLASALDADYASVGASQRRLELAQAAQETQLSKVALAKMMGSSDNQGDVGAQHAAPLPMTPWPRPYDAWPPPYPLDPDEAVKKASENYNEFSILEKTREEMANSLKFAWFRFLPAPTVSVGRSMDFLNNNQGYYATLGLAIPIWMGGERYTDVKKTEILVARLDRRLAEERVEFRQHIESLIKTVKISREIYELTQKKSTLESLKLEDARDDFKAGKIPYSLLVDEEIRAIESAISAAEAFNKYYKSKVELDVLMGEQPR